MKHFNKFAILLCGMLTLATLFPTNTNASQPDVISEIEMLENGFYFETIIESEDISSLISPRAAVKYTTKTKTTNMKDSSGNTLWYVSITATFSYNGSSATCLSCSPNAKSYASTWTIASVTSNKSGNTATATAVAIHGISSGISESFTKSVTIKCDGSGTVS